MDWIRVQGTGADPLVEFSRSSSSALPSSAIPTNSSRSSRSRLSATTRASSRSRLFRVGSTSRREVWARWVAPRWESLAQFEGLLEVPSQLALGVRDLSLEVDTWASAEHVGVDAVQGGLISRVLGLCTKLRKLRIASLPHALARQQTLVEAIGRCTLLRSLELFA